MKVLLFVYSIDYRLLAPIRNRWNMTAPTESTENKSCKLYGLTHGRLLFKRTWRNFLKNLSGHKVFFHNKKFKQAHPEFTYLELPSILLKDDHGITVLVTAQEINALENTDELIGVFGQKLSWFV